MHERVVNLFCRANPHWVDVRGSGILIGPGLVLTARHVVEIFERNYKEARHRGECADALEMYGVQAWMDPPQTIIYKVRSWSLALWADLGILEVDPASDLPLSFQWRALKLDLMPPRIGEPVAAFGFDLVEDRQDESRLEVSARAVTSTGIIRSIHSPRGLETLRGWRFQFNARIDGGMSGGPVVLNNTGMVVGVASQGLPPSTEDEEHASNAALLWPLVGMTVKDPRHPWESESRCTVLELVQAGVIAAAGAEHLSLVLSNEGIVTGIRRPASWTEVAADP
jgi:S1-C subfamily serine protease